jgi:hypothetical protein
MRLALIIFDAALTINRMFCLVPVCMCVLMSRLSDQPILVPIVQVNTYIEDCIAQKDPLIKILRLVCMQSVCNNGLKQKILDYYKREILQVHFFLITLQ